MAIVYNWQDDSGVCHKLPYGSCVMCAHCSDIYLDPWDGNAIYAVECDHKEEAEWRDCKDFKFCINNLIIEEVPD